ncbi:PepSY domain-containing protein [Alteromonas sp. ASW11-36]|uniref:PepSY domain-containing protein n=1 Tax=Alteromonas arenosi TaxID=3055817 RepID=A0ABT7STN4_9ALTE|nr:PepSY domain-containing protein [Alteromonas sp. ASW11-36]MDM7859556.1 PepSY domain-containing protein [Alteromonas sp. ASW11-36]
MRIWMKLHKWIGVLIGIQVLLWIAGGLYMSAVPLNWVHGKPLVAPHPAVELADSSNTIPYTINPADWHRVEWTMRIEQPVLKLTDFDGHTVFMDATSNTQQMLEPLSVEQLLAFIKRQYLGNGNLQSMYWVEQPPAEASGIQFPVYTAQFDDWINTTFYIHPYTGQVLKVRSDIWRLFDIFWMLHIMDYETRDNFNNPLLIIAAIIALFFTVTGMVLTVSWIRRSLRYNRTWYGKKST